MNKTRKTLIALTMVGATPLLGCETGAGSLGLGLLLGGIAPSIPVADGGRIVGIGGDALVGYGNAQNRVDSAAAGRPQQNINVNVNNGAGQGYIERPRKVIPEHVIDFGNGRCNPEPGYQWVNPNDGNDLRVMKKQVQKEVTILSCNSWEDRNGNGNLADDPIIGRKNVFSKNEDIEINIIFKGYAGSSYQARLSNRTTGMIHWVNGKDGSTYQRIGNNEAIGAFKIIEKNLGLYSIDIFVDGDFVANEDITITE